MKVSLPAFRYRAEERQKNGQSEADIKSPLWKFLCLPFFSKKVSAHWKPNKKKETKQIVVYWEKLVNLLLKVFPYKRSGKTISSISYRDIWGGQKVSVKNQERSFINLQPKENNYLRSSSKRSWKFKRIKQKAVQAKKSVRWMPWHWETMKDVITCDKLRRVGNKHWPADFRMGKPGGESRHLWLNS